MKCDPTKKYDAIVKDIYRVETGGSIKIIIYNNDIIQAFFLICS